MTPRATPLFCGIILLCLGALPLSAFPARSFERAELFATCSGKLAALATRQQALHDSAAPASQLLAQTFDMLLDATMPDAIEQGVPVGQSTVWRSRGWAEMAGLLFDVDQSTDRLGAERAVALQIKACRDLVLPHS